MSGVKILAGRAALASKHRPAAHGDRPEDERLEAELDVVERVTEVTEDEHPPEEGRELAAVLEVGLEHEEHGEDEDPHVVELSVRAHEEHGRDGGCPGEPPATLERPGPVRHVGEEGERPQDEEEGEDVTGGPREE